MQSLQLPRLSNVSPSTKRLQYCDDQRIIHTVINLADSLVPYRGLSNPLTRTCFSWPRYLQLLFPNSSSFRVCPTAIVTRQVGRARYGSCGNHDPVKAATADVEVDISGTGDVSTWWPRIGDSSTDSPQWLRHSLLKCIFSAAKRCLIRDPEPLASAGISTVTPSLSRVLLAISSVVLLILCTEGSSAFKEGLSEDERSQIKQGLRYEGPTRGPRKRFQFLIRQTQTLADA